MEDAGAHRSCITEPATRPSIHPSVCSQLYRTLLTPVHVCTQPRFDFARPVSPICIEHAHTVPYRVSRRARGVFSTWSGRGLSCSRVPFSFHPGQPVRLCCACSYMLAWPGAVVLLQVGGERPFCWPSARGL
jgi:hypothetical protein